MLALDRYRLKVLVSEGHRGAQRTARLLRRKDRLLGLILLGNNLVNISASAITTILALNLFGDAGVAVATLALTLIIIIFAEIGPKTAAALHPEAFISPASMVLLPLLYLLWPAVWVLNTMSNLMLGLFGVDPQKHGTNEGTLGREELRILLLDPDNQALPDVHRHLLLNLLNLEKTTVDHIMVPRSEVRSIDIESGRAEFERQLDNSRLSEVPLHFQQHENIVGMLTLSDAPKLLQGTWHARRLRRVMQKPYFIPEGTPLLAQLLAFRTQRSNTGCVVDEYGVFQGIVTLHDILEEMVGKMGLGSNTRLSVAYPQADGSFIIDASAPVHDINRTLGWQLPTDGPNTLNGLIIERMELIPKLGLGCRLGDYVVEEIINVRGHVVQRARLHYLPLHQNDEESAESGDEAAQAEALPNSAKRDLAQA